jgi:uncharacterized protein YecT (DUF1311 family)
MAEDFEGETTSRITLERERYEELLIELGELRRTSRLLDEYRALLESKDRELKDKEKELEEIKEILLETEWKDYELDMAQKRTRELEAEIARMKQSQSLWKRLWG